MVCCQCDCKVHPVFYSGAASVLPGCVECCEVREVCLFANPDIGQRLRVNKDSGEIVAHIVNVLSMRSVARPDGPLIFFKIISQKSHWPYDVSR